MDFDIKVAVEKVKNGNEDVFNEIVKLYTPKLKLIGLYYLNSPEDVEDIIQEVWFKVFKYINSLKNNSKFPSWITKIMRNHCLTFIESNHKHRKKIISIDCETKSEFISAYFCSDDNCWKNIENKNAKELVNRILKKIPETYSIILKLYYIENLKLKEVAELMDLPESTVKWRNHQGRLLFKKYSTKILKDMI